MHPKVGIFKVVLSFKTLHGNILAASLNHMTIGGKQLYTPFSSSPTSPLIFQLSVVSRVSHLSLEAANDHTI